MDIKDRGIKDKDTIDPLDKREVEKRTASDRAKYKVTGFVRRRRYEILLKEGIPQIEAARRVGIEIPRHKRLRPDEILKKIQEGR